MTGFLVGNTHLAAGWELLVFDGSKSDYLFSQGQKHQHWVGEHTEAVSEHAGGSGSALGWARQSKQPEA